MARPEKNNVDYFPFICEEGNKMFYIEEVYGNDGFATFVKLLRELARTDFHYLNLSKTSTLMYLSAKCKVSKDVLLSIINDLVDLGKFDETLWKENRVVWCQDFVDGIQDAYKKRNNKCITYEGLLLLLQSLSIRKPQNQDLNSGDNSQSKVKYSKEEESKVKKSKLNNTLLSEINISDLESNEVEYFEIAVAFQKLFIKNLEETQAPTLHQKNAKYKNYVNPIRLMMQNDGVTKEQLQKVFKYLDSPEGDFWKPNILSTKKLREKFSQLIIKSNQKNNGNRNNNNAKSDSDLKREASNAVDKMFGGQQ